MSSGDCRVYGLHGETLGDDCSSGSSGTRDVHRDVLPDPPAEVPVTRLTGSVAGSGLSSDTSREHRDQEASWRPYSWGDHDSWGDNEWRGQWASHSDTSCRGRWQWSWSEQDDSRGGRDRHQHARPERHREPRDSPGDREAPTRQMVETEPRDDTILMTDEEPTRNGPRTDRPQLKTSLSTPGWKRSDDQHLRTSLLPSVTLGKVTVGSPVPETQCGKGGNTSTMPTRATSRADACGWPLEGAIAPPKGSLSPPSMARMAGMMWALRRGHIFVRWRHGAG